VRPARREAAVPEFAVECRVDVRPRWRFRLRGASPDGVQRRHGAGVQRLIRTPEGIAHVAAVQPAPDRVVIGARAATEAGAQAAIERMRFALGVDDDLAEFHARFRRDPVIGDALRTAPWLRAQRRPDPWEALGNAVTEQLIEFERAVGIQRRMIARLGHRCATTGLRLTPTAAEVAAVSPAQLESFDLGPKFALALHRVAKEVAAGRVDFDAHEPTWERLLAIRGIGPWTVEMLALNGQGRLDVVPAGDVGYLKIVGRLLTGNPKARVEVDDVRTFFDRYDGWRGMAGVYLFHAAAGNLLPLRVSPPSRSSAAPRPAAARWSAPGPRSLAA
jgi:DNA-3-methyladenine glycosylase II